MHYTQRQKYVSSFMAAQYFGAGIHPAPRIGGILFLHASIGQTYYRRTQRQKYVSSFMLLNILALQTYTPRMGGIPLLACINSPRPIDALHSTPKICEQLYAAQYFGAGVSIRLV